MKKTQYNPAVSDICHFDISGVDSVALGAFYHSVFGWEIDEKGSGYSLVKTPEDGPNGAIIESETPNITLGISVDSLMDTLSEVVVAGGKISMPITDNGWVKKAQFKDTAGNLVTLIER